MTKLNELPEELIFEIGSYMKFFELSKLHKFCPEFNYSLNKASGRGNDYDLWKPYFKNYFPKKTKGERTYKEAFKVEYGAILNKVIQNGRALVYAFEKLKNDKKIVLAAVAQYGRALEYASQELKKNKEVVLAAVAQYGLALEYASEELKNDKEVVLAAVAQKGYALYYASAELKRDREVVLAAVRENGKAFVHASKALQNDPFINFATNHRTLDLALQYPYLTTGSIGLLMAVGGLVATGNTEIITNNIAPIAKTIFTGAATFFAAKNFSGSCAENDLQPAI